MTNGIRIILLALLAAFGAGLFGAILALVGRPGGKDWVVAVKLTRAASLHIKVAPLLRAATTPLGRRLLAGSRWRTRGGVVAFADENGSLVAHCAPCQVRIAELSPQPLHLFELTLRLRRQQDRVAGRLSAANGGAAQVFDFNGTLADSGLDLQWAAPRSPLAGLLDLFIDAIPEARRATVLGYFSATGTLSLPQGKWSATPQVEGFEVHGLGTERLRYGGIEFVCRDASGLPQWHRSGDGAPDWLTPHEMGRTLPRAVVAAEDSRFHHHPGYDPRELVPLLADAGRSGHRGASTLTQQLAKNLFTGADRSGARKLRELLYAVEMERTLGKQRILQLYLNTVDWGPGICGANAAARRYFSRAPQDLNPVQAAWLAGILRNPHRAYREEFLAARPERRRLNWVLAQTPGASRRHGLGWARANVLGGQLAQVQPVR